MEPGASLFGGPDEPTGRLKTLSEKFALGYVQHINPSSGATVKISIGTSNDFPSGWTDSDRSEHGADWATMVNNANAWAANAGYSDWISFSGANDMEPGFDGPNHTRTWVNGFKGAGFAWNVFDYGGAAGCPTQTGNNQCNNGWYTDDVVYVSWSSGTSNPLPEIYGPTNASQWYYMDVYADNHGTKMNFAGSTSECAAVPPPGAEECSENTPDQAWSQLWNAVNPTPGDDIHWSINFVWD